MECPRAWSAASLHFVINSFSKRCCLQFPPHLEKKGVTVAFANLTRDRSGEHDWPKSPAHWDTAQCRVGFTFHSWLSFAHLLDRWLNCSKTRQNEGMQSNILTSLIESNPIKPKSLCEPLGLFTLNKSVVHCVNPRADRVHPLGPHMKNEHQSTRL